MHTVRIKPLSANKAYKGRHFRTKELKEYQEALYLMLPKRLKIPEGRLEIHYIFSFSSTRSDIDNAIKQFQDCLATVYGFNDNVVFRVIAEKKLVPKGSESVSFEIHPYA